MVAVDRIQGLSGSLAIKTPVRAATTAAISLSGEQTIDGVVVVEGDRVLVKDQASGADNGVYDASTGAWTRSLDFDGPNDIRDGTLVLVGSGTANGDLLFRLNATEPIVVGTTALSFAVSAVFSEATAFGASLIEAADAAAARTTLGLPDVSQALPDVSQAEAEAGTGTSVRAWTPERVAQAIAALAAGSGKVQDFRLTLTTALPVTTTDVTAAGTIYCTPYKGNQIALYTGSVWVTRTSAEFSLALSALTSGKPYDVFCYDNAGTPTLEFLAWTNNTTRATALVMQDGVLCKTGALTRRYLGTFYTTSTTQTEDSAANRNLYNFYNQAPRKLKKYDTTATWSYATATWRSMHNSTANRVNVMTGVAGHLVLLDNDQLVINTATGIGEWGIAVNGTATDDSDSSFYSDYSAGSRMGGRTSLYYAPAVGYNYYQATEKVIGGAGGCTFHGAYASRSGAGLIGRVDA